MFDTATKIIGAFALVGLTIAALMYGDRIDEGDPSGLHETNRNSNLRVAGVNLLGLL